jgi:aryl-alcohol dehydrogenase-like predicted oxidoreductase
VKYRFLGKTGLKVSELGLGAMTFGRETSEPDSHRLLDHFVEVGGNFVDTADIYSVGGSEKVVGTWLKTKARSSVILATKTRYAMSPDPNDLGLSRKHILDAIDASLKRLGTDYIDLYQVHCWDSKTPLEETLSTLDTLVKSGKVRYIGASNFNGWQLQKALDISRQMGWEAFCSLQPQYNLLCRSTEWELTELCVNEGLGLVAWSPLRGGWLSGRFNRSLTQAPAGSRIETAEAKGWDESWTNYNNDYTWQVIDALLAVAQETGKTAAQVAINWLLQRPGVTAPIVGARTMEQLQDNLGAAGWALDADQMARLNQASDLPLPYPYSEIVGAQLRR